MDLEVTNIVYKNIKYKIVNKKNEFISNKIKKSGKFFEINILEKISSLNKYGVYIDIGSNIGNHSLFFANHCFSSIVYSIECFPDTYEILKKNIKLNKTNTEIITMKYAISDKIGRTFLLKGKKYRSGKNRTTDKITDVQAEMITIDRLFYNIDNISLMKIDVEGDELKVINGALNIINKYKPLIIIEINPKNKGKLYNDHINNLNIIMKLLYDYEIKNKFGITYILESSIKNNSLK